MDFETWIRDQKNRNDAIGTFAHEVWLIDRWTGQAHPKKRTYRENLKIWLNNHQKGYELAMAEHAEYIKESSNKILSYFDDKANDQGLSPDDIKILKKLDNDIKQIIGCK